MIVVKSIEVVHVDRQVIEMAFMDQRPRAVFQPEGRPPEMVTITKKMVTGEHFVNSNGEHFFIGWTKQVQDVLGVPFQSFRKLEKEVRDWKEQSNRNADKAIEYIKKFDRVQHMTFWERARFLFTRRLP